MDDFEKVAKEASDLKERMRVEAGLSYVQSKAAKNLEGVVQQGKPRLKMRNTPYFILDKNGVIRYASEPVRHFTGIDTSEFLGKKYMHFLAWDMYASALRPLAHRIDITKRHLEDFTKERLIKRYKRLFNDLGRIKKRFSPFGHALQMKEKKDRYMKNWDREPSRHEMVIRLKSSSDEAVPMQGDVYFYQHPEHYYAGALVMLRNIKTSWTKYFLRNPFAQRQLTVTNQYVMPVFSLKDEEAELQNIVREILDEERRMKDQETILDLGLLDDVHQENLNGILSQLGNWNLIVGTNNDDIRNWVGAHPLHKKTSCFQLQYPPLMRSTGPDKWETLTSHVQIQSHVNAGFKRLEEKIHADRISEEGVREVQLDTQGKGDDVQADS